MTARDVEIFGYFQEHFENGRIAKEELDLLEAKLEKELWAVAARYGVRGILPAGHPVSFCRPWRRPGLSSDKQNVPGSTHLAHASFQQAIRDHSFRQTSRGACTA